MELDGGEAEEDKGRRGVVFRVLFVLQYKSGLLHGG